MTPDDIRRIFSSPPRRKAEKGGPRFGDHILNPELKPDPPWTPAAVLVGLVMREDGLHVLLTTRHADLRAHGGQISFPGGRIDADDESPEAAALREANEEIGLPENHAEVLGTLPTYLTRSGFEVTPVVALITPGFAMKLNPAEVDDAFEAPLALFLDKKNCRRHTRPWQGKDRFFHAFVHKNRYIWGATAGMMITLRDLVHDNERKPETTAKTGRKWKPQGN